MNSDAQRILFTNRTQYPTLANLQDQINALAKIILEQPAPSVVTPIEPLLSNIQTRSLDTDFVISLSRNALAFYTIEQTATRLLTGTDTAQVDLVVAGNIIGTVKNLLTVTLALGVQVTQTHQKILMGFVPAGSTINLTSSGSGTSTLIQSMEVLL